MPNSTNRKTGTGLKEEVSKKTNAPEPNPKRPDKKHGDHLKDYRGDTGRSFNQGRKAASGGS